MARVNAFDVYFIFLFSKNRDIQYCNIKNCRIYGMTHKLCTIESAGAGNNQPLNIPCGLLTDPGPILREHLSV